LIAHLELAQRENGDYRTVLEIAESARGRALRDLVEGRNADILTSNRLFSNRQWELRSIDGAILQFKLHLELPQAHLMTIV
jgi:hypothetical protein